MWYLDSSVVIKLYFPEPQTKAVSKTISTQRHALIYTSFHELEIKNAIALKVFRNEIEKTSGDQIYRDLDNDFDRGILTRPVIDWSMLFAESVRISRLHTRSIGTRSLDILHVAAAILLGCREFLSFDSRQLELAKKMDLNVITI